jgi:hypothetical protein
MKLKILTVPYVSNISIFCLFRVLTAAELQLFEAGDPGSINPEMGVDEQAELLPYNRQEVFQSNNGFYNHR